MSVHADHLNAGAIIAGNVRAEVARQRIPQARTAAALGQNQQWLSRRMTGHVEFRISELLILAEFLDVPITDLLPKQKTAAPVRDDGRQAVAGAGFEPATSGSRARHLQLVSDDITRADVELVA